MSRPPTEIHHPAGWPVVRRLSATGVSILLALGGCALAPEEAATRLDAAVAEVTTADVKSAVLWVDAPRWGLDRGFAHGFADVVTGAAMTPQTPFYSASVGKLLVAAAVHDLVAEGAVALDAPITRYVPLPSLNGIPVFGGTAGWDQVTIAALLGHRTGLPCYFSDPPKDGASRVFDRIVAEPSRTWARQDLFDYTRDHYESVGPPGAAFHYSDTNFDLLGLVLEGVTGAPFHLAVRGRVMEPLGLRGTWYHAFESAPEGQPPPADLWVRGQNLRGVPALSADQAGGGLITTAPDLRRLLRGLLAGDPVPLAALAQGWTEDAVHSGIDVGLGAWRIRPGGIFFALAGQPTLVGHSGSTGVFAYHVADWDAVLVGAVSDTSWEETHVEFLLSEVLPVLGRVRTKR